ncbi:replication initiator protein A domain protein [Oribacterium sp. oral taxon 108 str. F0425]|nr:replication initiator protein A domain protein [Oribacterium sp. oral taxon 108 str. F0425]
MVAKDDGNNYRLFSLQILGRREGGGMDFDYFYNREAEGFNFLKVPEILVEGEEFQGLSAEAILLYAMLLKRAGMSYKNNWLDKQNRVFIYFTVEEIMKKRHLSKPTAIKLLDELDKKNGIGLIERVRVGLGKPNIIYVKDFLSMVQEKSVVQKFKPLTSEVKNIDLRSKGNELQDVKSLNPNYIDRSNSNNRKREYSFLENGLGSFQNVFLQEKDRAELELLLNGQLNNYIERLSAYLKSSGKTYKDHKSTILSWFYKDQGNRRCIKASNIPSLEEYDKGEHL